MRPTIRLPDGTEMSYTTVGHGRRIVMLHGGPGLGHRYLRPAFDELVKGFEVLYYDQRGTGGTEVGGAEPTMDQHVRDLEALRRELGMERFNLVGHSAGALLGLLYAAAYPERVACLVAAGPAPPLDPRLAGELGAEMRRRYRSEDLAEMQAVERSAAFSSRDPKALERYFQVMYTPFFDDPESARRVDFGFTRITAKNVLGAEERAFAALDVEPAELLSRVTCPTLVVYGSNEPVPLEFARAIAETVRDGTLEVLDGVNHFGFVEAPDGFFAAVKPFLDQHAV